MLRRLEPFTLLLVLLCVGWTLQVEAFGRTYAAAGALNLEYLWRGAYLRALTTILIHGGWLHLIVNGLSLYLVGSVVARGCGRPILLVTVLLGSLAGLGASFLLNDSNQWRVGISGGVFALLGLILGVEWAMTTRFREFLVQRNTLLVAFFLVLNAALAVWFESRYPGLVDHGGHVGGFLFGTLFGFAYYARPRRVRPALGAAAALALGLGPLALAARPPWNPDYHLFRARIAATDEERVAAYERVLELAPGDLEAGTQLAVLRDDPAYLDGLDRPRGPAGASRLLRAVLQLVRNRFADDEGAGALVERAREIELGAGADWLAFARLAKAAGRHDLEAVALVEAAHRMPGRAPWTYARTVLPVYAALLRAEDLTADTLAWEIQRALAAAGVALEGLREEAGLDAEGRAELAGEIARLAAGIRRAAADLAGRGGEFRPALAGLSELYRKLAGNTPEAGRPRLRLEAARLYEQSLEGAEIGQIEEETLVGRWKAALDEAREAGDADTEARAARWFTTKGRPVPEPELAGPEDEG